MVQPAYGPRKAVTTWSGAETRLMFGQLANADGTIVSMVGVPGGEIKAIKVAREVHPLKALFPMVVTESPMATLASDLHS